MTKSRTSGAEPSSLAMEGSRPADVPTEKVPGTSAPSVDAAHPQNAVASCLVLDGSVLRLRGSVDIYRAQELRVELLKLTAQPPDDLVIDLSELEHLDAAAAQVLIAFRRELAHATLVPPSDPVRERLERVGVWRAL